MLLYSILSIHFCCLHFMLGENWGVLTTNFVGGHLVSGTTCLRMVMYFANAILFQDFIPYCLKFSQDFIFCEFRQWCRICEILFRNFLKCWKMPNALEVIDHCCTGLYFIVSIRRLEKMSRYIRDSLKPPHVEAWAPPPTISKVSICITGSGV